MLLSTSILVRLKHQQETIAELITGYSEEQLKQRVNPGKWSAFENIVHLVAYQPVFIHRVGLILEGNQPLFERYVAENDPLLYEYLQRSLPELLSLSAQDRALIVTKLEGLTEKELSLIGTHPKFGSMTITQWTELFLLHEAHHLWTIVQLISTFRVARQ